MLQLLIVLACIHISQPWMLQWLTLTSKAPQPAKILTALNHRVWWRAPSLSPKIFTHHIKASILTREVKDHIMACASMMRALNNEGYQADSAHMAKPLYNSGSTKCKLMPHHWSMLHRILNAMSTKISSAPDQRLLTSDQRMANA